MGSAPMGLPPPTPPTGEAPSTGSDQAEADKQALITRTTGHLRRLLYFRRQYDQRRSQFYRQYVSSRDQRYFPDNVTPRSNTFVPYPYANVEQIVSRVDDAFFSFDPWFECKGQTAQDEQPAEKMGLVLHYGLRRAKLKPEFEAFVRNVAIYGFGAIKIDWDWGYDMVVDPQPEFFMQAVEVPIQNPDGSIGTQTQQQPVINSQTGMPIVKSINPITRPVQRNRPKFLAIDIYDIMVDPDGGLTAHSTEKTIGQLKREIQSNPNMYFPEGIAELERRIARSETDPDNVLVRIAELWDEINDTVTLITFGEDREAISWKDTRASYRATSYSAWKRKIYGGQPILLFHGPNQFAHKKAPILYTSYSKLSNEMYGLGAIEIISDLSESMNKFANMITDNWNLGINRRYVYDTTRDIDHTALNAFNVPGGKVGVTGDVSNAVMPLPVMTPTPGDYQIMELYKLMIEVTSGISDFYSKGIGTPTNNRTASGINQVITETNFRFKLFIRNLEIDILQPLLEMCASMYQQFSTDPVEMEVTGEPAQIPKWPIVQPEELIGNFKFDLVAANYATNKVVRQRNLLALVNLAAQSPFFNQYEGLRELFKVFEVRNMNRLLKQPEQVAQEQQQQLEQQIQMMMLEKLLDVEGKARLSQAKPQGMGKGKEGRPAKMQFEGKIPGAGLSSVIRDLAQNLTGASAYGLEGTEGQ